MTPPTFNRVNSLCVVFDRLTKYSHFTPLKHPYTAKTMVELFLKNIFYYHGLPTPYYQTKIIHSLVNSGKNFSLSKECKWI